MFWSFSDVIFVCVSQVRGSCYCQAWDKKVDLLKTVNNNTQLFFVFSLTDKFKVEPRPFLCVCMRLCVRLCMYCIVYCCIVLYYCYFAPDPCIKACSWTKCFSNMQFKLKLCPVSVFERCSLACFNQYVSECSIVHCVDTIDVTMCTAGCETVVTTVPGRQKETHEGGAGAA